MKKLRALKIIFLLTLLTPLGFVSITEASQTTENNWLAAFQVPEGLSTEPLPAIPENFTDSYLNTTNPYSDLVSPLSALDEVDDIEGSHPIYVLVAGDEEEREIWRQLPPDWIEWSDWKSWATLQIERGDEALVNFFGIDIRILGFIEWSSDNSKTTMDDLWYDLETKTKDYLGTWYEGEYWQNHVDAVIGITAQDTPGDPVSSPGRAPGPAYIDQGRIFILLKWQVHWMDDNIVQHEISHLFYADDHYIRGHIACCVMEGDTHYYYWIWEDGLWLVFNNIPCAYTAYSWCTSCSNVINAYQNLYSSSYNDRLILRHGDPDDPKCSFLVKSAGITEPIYPGHYTFLEPITLTFEVTSIAPGYKFLYWLVDGQQKIYTQSVTITISGKRTLAAYFYYPPPSPPGGGSGGVPGMGNPILGARGR